VRFQSCSTIISLICVNKPLITNVTYHIAWFKGQLGLGDEASHIDEYPVK
jgi:hypothetical protein